MQTDNNISEKSQVGHMSSEPSPGGYMGNVGTEGQTDSYTLEEALELQRQRIESADANPAAGSGAPNLDGGDVILTFIVIGIALGGLAAYFFSGNHVDLQKLKNRFAYYSYL